MTCQQFQLTPEQLKSEAQTYTNASEQLRDAIN